MDENKLPKIIVNYKPGGHRGIRNPKTRWRYGLN
jgi:hypothetical protein